MPNILYGLDLDQKITPVDVRNALVQCFFEAHCEDTGLDKNVSDLYCRELVKKAFDETSGDFENPTKESIEKVLAKLADFSKNFRSPEIIKKHYSQMLQIMEHLH